MIFGFNGFKDSPKYFVCAIILLHRGKYSGILDNEMFLYYYIFGAFRGVFLS